MTELNGMLRTLILIGVLVGLTNLHAQCGQDYSKQVEQILVASKSTKTKLQRLVLAGSSTFRLWTDAGDNFPRHFVVNAGIGGSCFDDLWKYREQLLIETKPEILAIYEGDNDLAAGRSIEEIVQNAEALIVWFQERTNFEVPIVLVAPKPSPLRIALAADYVALNAFLKAVCIDHNVGFVDTWSVLCTPEWLPNIDFFKEDQLHLNDKGNLELAKAMNDEFDRLNL